MTRSILSIRPAREPGHEPAALRCSIFLYLVFACVVAPLWAHDPGISTAQGRLRAGAFELTVGFAPADAQQLLPPAARTTGKWTQAEFDAARDLLVALAPNLWELSAGGSAIAPRETRVQLAAGDSLNFMFVYARPPSGPLKLRALKLGELPPGHREFVVISDEHGLVVAKKLLRTGNDTVEIPLVVAQPVASQPGTLRQASGCWEMLQLGFEQIWTGFGHLPFLLVLLVVCRGFRSFVTIISCLTLAFASALILVTLHYVSLPDRVAEAAIAASIVFLGIENILRRDTEPSGRWALTLAFGLFHGFGFASTLRQLGVGEDGHGLAMPLAAFVLGVVIGQATIGAILLPGVWWGRRTKKFARLGVPAFSAILSAAGLYWFLERTFRS